VQGSGVRVEERPDQRPRTEPRPQPHGEGDGPRARHRLRPEHVRYLWAVRVSGDDGELRPWHFIYVSIESRMIRGVDPHYPHYLRTPDPS
jgi:hypothetical protein